MDNELPPVDTRPDEPLPLAEDYENLGHTFLGGYGNHNPVIRATIIKEEAREPLLIDWTKVIWWLLGVTVIAFGLLVAWVITAIVHHIHSTQAPAAPPQNGSGRVFAIVTVVVVVLVAARAVVRWIRGD